MYFISHRGNTLGPDISKENSVDYINDAIKKGYDVEIDVWFQKENFYLGHDKPTYLVDDKYLLNKKLWCHSKNLDSLINLKKIWSSLFLARK